MTLNSTILVMREPSSNGIQTIKNIGWISFLKILCPGYVHTQLSLLYPLLWRLYPFSFTILVYYLDEFVISQPENFIVQTCPWITYMEI